GTLLTAAILFTLIDSSVIYWAHGFSPCSALTCAYSSTNFIVQTSFPHEHNVAGALFQTMTQASLGKLLAISTIVFNTVVDKESAKLGVTINSRGTDAPIFAQLMGYEDAQ
ncbi:hypothetical protein DFJ58DRAFT_643755, partial [Suillus subalutaceus]|uniref:uncharacterized protein n=1 Tax=Suillus subalutaceus TaxID=48586 RepID=UPI001B86F706